MDLPRVTAVLICWNHERFARKAVLSVLDQSYPNQQVIVIDNGSTDGSRRVLQQLREEREFTLVCQPNAGLMGALNQGLAMAEGEYFTYLATDDMWLPDKTERQVRYLQAHPEVHLVAGKILPVDQDDRPCDWSHPHRPGEVTFEKLMREGCNVSGPTVMTRTSTLRAIGGYDEGAFIEDYSLALRITHEGYRAVTLDEPFTWYRRHGENWTSKPIWAERRAIGRPYRGHPAYPAYVRHNLRGYFRHLAGKDKRAALQLLREEPIAWTWDDLGVGLLKLMVPAAVQRVVRQHKGAA